jgi:hypothetical protein
MAAMPMSHDDGSASAGAAAGASASKNQDLLQEKRPCFSPNCSVVNCMGQCHSQEGANILPTDDLAPTGRMCDGTEAQAAFVQLGHPATFADILSARAYVTKQGLELAFTTHVEVSGGCLDAPLMKLDANRKTNLVEEFPDVVKRGNNTMRCTITCQECIDVSSRAAGEKRRVPKNYNGYSISFVQSADKVYKYLEARHGSMHLTEDAQSRSLQTLNPCVVSKFQDRHLDHEFNTKDQEYLSQLSVSVFQVII